MPELDELFEQIHAVTPKFLLFSIVIHVLAAMKHLLIDKQNSMSRMVKYLRK